MTAGRRSHRLLRSSIQAVLAVVIIALFVVFGKLSVSYWTNALDDDELESLVSSATTTLVKLTDQRCGSSELNFAASEAFWNQVAAGPVSANCATSPDVEPCQVLRDALDELAAAPNSVLCIDAGIWPKVNWLYEALEDEDVLSSLALRAGQLANYELSAGRSGRALEIAANWLSVSEVFLRSQASWRLLGESSGFKGGLAPVEQAKAATGASTIEESEAIRLQGVRLRRAAIDGPSFSEYVNSDYLAQSLSVYMLGLPGPEWRPEDGYSNPPPHRLTSLFIMSGIHVTFAKATLGVVWPSFLELKDTVVAGCQDSHRSPEQCLSLLDKVELELAELSRASWVRTAWTKAGSGRLKQALRRWKAADKLRDVVKIWRTALDADLERRAEIWALGTFALVRAHWLAQGQCLQPDQLDEPAWLVVGQSVTEPKGAARRVYSVQLALEGSLVTSKLREFEFVFQCGE